MDADLAPEAEAIARGVVEFALAVSWVGTCDERALRILAKGPRDQLSMLEKAKEEDFEVADELLEEQQQQIDQLLGGRQLKQAPNVQQLADRPAEVSAEVTGELYVLPFRRQSAAVHLDTVHIHSILEGTDTSGDMLVDVLVASSLLLGFVINTLQGGEKLEAIFERLQASARNK